MLLSGGFSQFQELSGPKERLPLFLAFVGVGLVGLAWFARLRFQRVGCTSATVLACRGRALFWTPLWVVFFTTLVLVTHDKALASRCSHVIRLDAGRQV